MCVVGEGVKYDTIIYLGVHWDNQLFVKNAVKLTRVASQFIATKLKSEIKF